MNQTEILKKVRRIELRTRHLVNTLLSGEYHSAFKGQGIEFSEVREYLAGDDIRSIDWNVTARMGHPYVKVFEEERELTVMLLVDASSSGDFGTSDQTKSEIAVELSALLAFSAIKNNDRVGLIIFTDKVERFIPPKKGRRHVLRVIRELLARFEGLNGDNGEEKERDDVSPNSEGDDVSPHSEGDDTALPHPVAGAVGSILIMTLAAFFIGWMGLPVTTSGWAVTAATVAAALGLTGLVARWGFRKPTPEKGRGTDLEEALDFLNRVTTRRGIVFVISDFQDTGFEKSLSIARQRHDVVAVTITDPREASLVGAGLLSLEDPETGEQVVVDTSDAAFRKEYERLAHESITGREMLFKRTGVDFIDVWTDKPYVDPLVRFFSARANRL